jgi:SAM-dependent methyltransferase
MPEDWERIRQVHGEMLREQWPEVAESPAGKWIDWGCGGGATAAALSWIAEEVVGVDVSMASLTQCGETRGHRLGCRFLPVWIAAELPVDAVDPVLALRPAVERREAAGFFSTSTFQHFPSKQYTERVVAMIPHLLRPGGYVLIQIRRNTPLDMTRDPSLPYAARAMVTTSYGVAEFRDLLQNNRISVERTEDREDMGRQYTYFFGRVVRG